MTSNRKTFNIIRSIILPYQFGFVQGHAHLDQVKLQSIKQVLKVDDAVDNRRLLTTYETMFASLVGAGVGVTFASGRMAFYVLMKVLGIGDGDEVILPAFTCAVMPNAVLRTGARPVYADIDRNTFGSDAHAIEKVITKRTRLIVAQHSFGIPCNIHEIMEVARRSGIPVVEDCAITLDSALNGTKVGNWGDAAIFSTDHSKPLNTLIGGFLYTKNHELYHKVREYSVELPGISLDHQHRLYAQLLLERSSYTPDHYPRAQLLYRLRTKLGKIRGNYLPVFLENDYSVPKIGSVTYHYPATLPAFLAQLGVFELERWHEVKSRRKNLLARLIQIFEQSTYASALPSVYRDPNRDIVPLRFAFACPEKDKLLPLLASIIDVNGIWFQQPVICAVDGLESIWYSSGSCPESEKLCSTIINVPCTLDDRWSQLLERRLCDILRIIGTVRIL